MGGRDIEGRVSGMGLPPLYLTSGNGLVGLSSHQLIMQVCSEKLFEGRPRVRCAFRQITLTTRCYDTDLPVHAHDHGLRERLHAESVYTLVVMALDRYLAIVHPVRSISWRTVRNSAIAILLTWVTSRFTNNLSL